MPTGVVTSLDAAGFGFIAPDSGGGDFWIRPRSIVLQAKHGFEAGDAVEFELRSGDLGPEPINIRRRSADALA